MPFKQNVNFKEGENRATKQWIGPSVGFEMFFVGWFETRTKDYVYFLKGWEADFAARTNLQ